jgi:hypothetical protein
LQSQTQGVVDSHLSTNVRPPGEGRACEVLHNFDR